MRGWGHDKTRQILTSEERERLKELERENRELRGGRVWAVSFRTKRRRREVERPAGSHSGPTPHWTRRAFASIAPRPDEQLGRWLKPGIWFWAAALAGLAIRAYLVLFTEGTYDVGILAENAEGVRRDGLVGYYWANPAMNLPPFIAVLMSWVWSLAEATEVPFRVLLRAPFALLDAATAALLLGALRANRYRFVLTACYWLHPLALIFSAYHGNTDSSVAFFLVSCVYLLSIKKTTGAAVALGISLWIKLPGLLAIPALLFFLPSWLARLQFITVACGVSLVTYLPLLPNHADVLYRNVIGYRGQLIQTAAGIPVWGMRALLPYPAQLAEGGHEWLAGVVLFYLKENYWLTLASILLLVWLRRSRRTIQDMGETIAGSYCVLYGLSIYWSFQYFAWSIPFWFLARKSFAVPATILASGYIYGLYWFLCGNPWLLGEWDFMGHPFWPHTIRLLRNGALLFFFLSAWLFLAGALYEKVVMLYQRTRGG